MNGRLGIGLVGSGFNAGFHLQAFRAVREADVRGVWSPDPAKPYGWVARLYFYLQAILGWTLSLLAVAGFSGLVRIR